MNRSSTRTSQRKPMKLLNQLLLTIAVCVTAHAAVADEPYPNKPVHITVPYSPGGPFDVLTRGLGQTLSVMWKQPVIVENRPGANEIIGASFVAKSPPDGYNLLTTTESGIITNAYLYRKLPYNPETDLAPVTHLVQVPEVLVVPASLPVNTLKEFIDHAKKNSINYSSSGLGGATHLPLAMLANEQGIQMTHVPYKGAAPQIQDLLAGQVQLGAISASAVQQYISAGSLKGLAVSAPKRIPSLPQVPTFAEAGVNDVRATFMIGMAAPAGTPDSVLQKIARDVRTVLLDPEFRAKFIDPYAFNVIASSPSDYRAYLVKERPIQAERVRISGAKLD